MNFGATVNILGVNNLRSMPQFKIYSLTLVVLSIPALQKKKNTLYTSGNIPFDEKNLRSYRKIQRYPINYVYLLTKLWIISSSVYNIIQDVRGEE